MKTLNLNSYVRIKLTEFGLKELKKQHNKLKKKNPSIGKFTPPETDKDGFCEMQLWVVMNTFGKYLYNGSPNIPFELTIQIDEAQFN